jgi:four helix bundle protein
MRDHKSILAWQEARAVVFGVLELSSGHWRPHLGAIFSQLQRSSVSVMVNVAEGYGWLNTPTFTRHLRIAYGSAIETADLLEVLQESGSAPPETTAPILEHCRRSQRLLLGLLKRRFPASTVHR